MDLSHLRQGKSSVIKTSTRQTVLFSTIGLVDHNTLKLPGDLIGLNKDCYLVLETRPAEYDSRVKVMEAHEEPTEVYADIGGLNQPIEKLVEAVVLPMQRLEKVSKSNLQKVLPAKSIGLTLRHVNVRSPIQEKRSCPEPCIPKESHLKLAGPKLVQMFMSRNYGITVLDSIHIVAWV